MVAVESTMLPIGTPAPPISLADVRTGRVVDVDDYAGQPFLVMFICNHCPYVVHVRDEITRVTGDYAARGVGIVAINSNSIETHPQDGPVHMEELARRMEWSFPFCFDATQDVAKAYRAACTPDFFLFDPAGRLFYRGQLDDSRPGNRKPLTGADLRAALDLVLAGGTPPAVQRPSIGCNIKWKPGNEPAWFG